MPIFRYMPHRYAAILTDWKARTGKTDAECAEWCELSESAFFRQRTGRVKPTRMRQTVKLARLHALVDTGKWLEIALLAADVAKSLRK